jgi:hypothetical protein
VLLRGDFFDAYKYELEQRGLRLPVVDYAEYERQCRYWRDRLRALYEQEAAWLETCSTRKARDIVY